MAIASSSEIAHLAAYRGQHSLAEEFQIVLPIEENQMHAAATGVLQLYERVCDLRGRPENLEGAEK